MNPRIRSRMPASIGSNQASPVNKVAACVVVLSSPMAWSPPARQRRSWLVDQAGDYATFQFHHFRDGTVATRDIALEMLVNRALNSQDQKLLALMVKRVGVALRIQRNNGIVRSTNGPGQFMLWEVAR